MGIFGISLAVTRRFNADVPASGWFLGQGEFTVPVQGGTVMS